MKSIIIISATILLLVTPVLAVIGPIPVDESNDLVDGKIYGWVTITKIDDYCVEIKADANETVLIPGENFGIQAFGFNYNGSTSCLDVTAPVGWVESTGTLDGFGIFIEKVDTTGSYRQDPLFITVCNTCGELQEADVVVANAKGYTFAMHIADFSGNECIDDTDDCSSAFFATKKTTQIELSSFTAKPANGSVTLNWATETEIDNVGFNILRATAEDGVYVKINAELIPAQGGAAQGAAYQFVDTNVRNRKTYYYKLEDIDLNGTATAHGPVSATPKWIYAIFK